MNYRSGLQRLYVVFCVVWIVGALFAVQYGDWHPDKFFNGGWETVGIAPAEEFRLHWPSIVIVSCVPPIVAYIVLFHIAPWIMRGFKKS
jgi:hypothetical protein